MIAAPGVLLSFPSAAFSEFPCESFRLRVHLWISEFQDSMFKVSGFRFKVHSNSTPSLSRGTNACLSVASHPRSFLRPLSCPPSSPFLKYAPLLFMVKVRHNLNTKGWNSHVHRTIPGKFESTNLSRGTLSRGIGRSAPQVPGL